MRDKALLLTVFTGHTLCVVTPFPSTPTLMGLAVKCRRRRGQANCVNDPTQKQIRA